LSAGVCCAMLFPTKKKNRKLYIVFFIIFSF
jgi:hypothetical protein